MEPVDYLDIPTKRFMEKIQLSTELLRRRGYDISHIEPEEFYQYLTGSTPTGDITTIGDTLGNRYLTVHEVIEISELKKMGVPINSRTVWDNPPEVYMAHMTAFELELALAKDEGDYQWIQSRISLVDSWLEDESMPQALIQRCKKMKDIYTENEA